MLEAAKHNPQELAVLLYICTVNMSKLCGRNVRLLSSARLHVLGLLRTQLHKTICTTAVMCGGNGAGNARRGFLLVGNTRVGNSVG